MRRWQGVGRGGTDGLKAGTLDVMETVPVQMSISDLLTTPNKAFFILKYVVGLTVWHGAKVCVCVCVLEVRSSSAARAESLS